jgi:hypothetical protein
MTEQLALFTVRQDNKTSDDYYTPKWIFDALGLEFDLDVACPPEGPLFTPAKAFYTQETDGLTSPWHGLVWMNPPYSKPAPWVDKWLDHGNGLALLPFAKSKWCQQLWDSDAAMIYVRAVAFARTDKSVVSQAPFSLGLWAVGQTAIKAMRRSKLGKVR